MPRKPDKTLFLVTKAAGRTFWMRYGAGWTNRDGSVSIKLDLLPETNFQLRDAESKTPETFEDEG